MEDVIKSASTPLATFIAIVLKDTSLMKMASLVMVRAPFCITVKHFILNIADIDECLSDPCHSNATCNNTDGSFTCTCISGYSGDGFQCMGKGDIVLLS